MRLSEAAIDAAFENHARRYGSERLWSVPYHVTCWAHAHNAFENGSDSAFVWLYEELRKRWQVFRSRNYKASTAEDVRRIMGALPAGLRNRRLGDFAEPTPAMLD